MSRPTLTWTAEGTCEVDGVEFVHSFEATPSATRFHIRKSRALLEDYVALVRERGGAGNVVEIGIAQGGSVALASLVAAPRRLVAIELSTQRVTALDELVDRRDLRSVVRPHYGIGQGDRARVAAIVDEELGGEPIDLVIDDASHLLEPTRATFETLFPRLRPGGIFAIEDWQWQHLSSDGLAAQVARSDEVRRALERALVDQGLPTERPLTVLVLELILARASSSGAIGDIRIDGPWVRVERGAAPLDPSTFRLDQIYVDRFGLLEPHVPEHLRHLPAFTALEG
jgi:predicted O-methyltransferase YrrM